MTLLQYECQIIFLINFLCTGFDILLELNIQLQGSQIFVARCHSTLYLRSSSSGPHKKPRGRGSVPCGPKNQRKRRGDPE